MALGLAERRTGLICLGAQSTFSGRKRWEDQLQQAVAALRQLADAHAQQDPTFRTSVTYTRLTAQAALKALREQGYSAEQLPSPSTMAEVLNRMGFRLRKVVKAKPQKKIKETDAIFDNIKKKMTEPLHQAASNAGASIKRPCTSAIFRAAVSRGTTKPVIMISGEEKYVPCGIVDEDSAELTITFGSSYKTSDFIVDAPQPSGREAHEKAATSLLQIKMDNGPESSGCVRNFCIASCSSPIT